MRLTVGLVLVTIITACNTPTWPSSIPTPTPDFNTPGAQARIISFTVSPPEILSPQWRQLGPGDTITVSWEAEGAYVIAPCSLDETCPPASLKDSRTYKFYDGPTNVADHWEDLYLAVHGTGDLTLDEKTLRVFPRCWYRWFKEGISDWCPDAENSIQAIAQSFEHGLMIAFATNNVTVLMYDDSTYRAFSNLANTPRDLATLQPPRGLHAPDARFAATWLGLHSASQDIRERLGWATAPPIEFDYQRQPERTPAGILAREFHLLPDGRILSVRNLSFHRLDQAQGEILVMEGYLEWASGK